MSNWKDMKKSEEKPVGRKIYGTYRCQYCPECVFEGMYYPKDQLLRYVCKDDHISYIENFRVSF
jgi:formylmethanofuran dehydrogenase subunit E